jgi:hypothetical protein
MFAISLVFLWGCNAPVQQELAQSAITAGGDPAPDPTPDPTPPPASATGQHLYVLSGSDSTVYAFSVLTDGNLSLVQSIGVQANAAILSMDTAGHTLYVYAFNQILQYSVDGSGALTNTTTGYSVSIFTAEANGADFSGAVTAEASGPTTYNIAGSALAQAAPSANYSVGADPVAMAMH